MTTHISDRDDRLDVLQYCGSRECLTAGLYFPVYLEPCTAIVLNTILKHTYSGRTEILARLVFPDIEIILITVACYVRHIPIQLLRIRSWRYSPCFL
jgi:hypothetical protein